ncbi:MAG: hypothetical protein C4527_14790 [Candidatus Omnitrophota bacterium]|nr:MAG: hypothetical protein C4527_14790 [Candidatus Omnitrophota bacterium]
MKSKTAIKSKITKEEIEQRLAVGNAVAEIEKMKRGMSGGLIVSSDTPFKEVPLQSLSHIGKSTDHIYKDVQGELSTFLNKLGEYAFSPSETKRYFPNNKIKYLIELMKKANMELEARYIMDIFKDRVKQLNGGKLPTVKEKSGLFGKVTERQMKPEEIALKFQIEENYPPGENKPLNVVGTQESLMNHLYEMLLNSEDILDPLKKGPRKTVARFLQAAGMLNPATKDPREKYFVACLMTPDKIQPQSIQDMDRLIKLQVIIKKGTEWLEEKLSASRQSSDQSSASQ